MAHAIRNTTRRQAEYRGIMGTPTTSPSATDIRMQT
jgi:hypothetical protein